MRYVWRGAAGRDPAPGGAMTLTRWLVREGDLVRRDQPVAEVSCDKASLELPSPVAGRIAKLHLGPGDLLPSGAPFASFEEVDRTSLEGAGEAGR